TQRRRLPQDNDSSIVDASWSPSGFRPKARDTARRAGSPTCNCQAIALTASPVLLHALHGHYPVRNPSSPKLLRDVPPAFGVSMPETGTMLLTAVCPATVGGEALVRVQGVFHACGQQRVGFQARRAQ